MALKTVSELKDSIAGLLSGVDLNNVDNVNGAIERAVRKLVQRAAVPEASATQNLNLYSGVFNYPCDDKIFGTAINDIKPQGNTRSVTNYVYKKPPADFDRTKGFNWNGTQASFGYVNGDPIIQISSVLTQQKINIDPMNETTGWTAAGSASGLARDTAVYYESPASLRFILTGSSTGTLTKTLTSTLDMTSYEDVGVAFLALRIPDGATASNLTSLTLKLGSDSGNYNDVSDTEGFLGAWVAGEWLLVAFDFAGASQTGTPNWAAIDYVQISFAHTGTFTNIRVGGLWIALPTPVQILYQTAAVFKAGTAATSETITDSDDSIILSNPAYTLLEYEGAISVLQQTGASEDSQVMQGFKKDLNGDGSDVGLYARFRGDNPSQQLRTIGNWY